MPAVLFYMEHMGIHGAEGLLPPVAAAWSEQGDKRKAE